MMGSDNLTEKKMILIGVLAIIFIAFLIIANLLDNKSLNGIKRKTRWTGAAWHGSLGKQIRDQKDFCFSAIRA